MANEVQNYQNHARFHPPFHFVLAPIVLIHFIWTAKVFISSPSWYMGEALMLAVGFVVMATLTRTRALAAQDRTIRLEERMRFERILAPDMAAKASDLAVGQIVALRFAPDAELAGLVGQVLSGKLTTQKDIKQAIVNWRPDYCRV